MLVLIFIISTLADQIAAYVGDDVILESEVAEYATYLASDPSMQGTFSDARELRDYVLNELITKKLLLVEAEIESITVTSEEVASQVDRQIENIKARFPSEVDFLKALQQYNITIEDLRKNYEENVKTQMIMQQLVQKKLATQIMISPIAVKRFYEDYKDSIAVLPNQVKLAHILLAIKPSEDELKKAFERALDVYKLLMTGGDFSVIAQEFSEDENSRKSGGMLGKMKKGETLEEFEMVIFNLKPGVISQPFPTRLGYHIVEVLNRGQDWVLLRQILMKVQVTKADTLRYERLAEEIRELIHQGADFDSLAKQYSDDPNVDLGEFYPDQMTPPFDEYVKNLKEGQVSEPILTPYGYHLLYVKEEIAQKVLGFEELRDQIYQYLYQEELQEYYTQLVEELEEKTFVKIFPR